MKLLALGLSLTFGLAAASGCTRLHELEADLVNHLRASDAWRDEPKSGPPGFERAFAKGWKQGYFDVASGEDGEPPVLPPNEYWTIGYRNPKGHEAVQAWFNGYRAGATAAERAGAREWSFIATEPPAFVDPIESHHGPLVDAPAEVVPPPEAGTKPQALPAPAGAANVEKP